MAFDFEMNCIENIGATTTITIDDGGVIKFRNSNSNMENIVTITTQKDLDKFIEIYLELRNLYK